MLSRRRLYGACLSLRHLQETLATRLWSELRLTTRTSVSFLVCRRTNVHLHAATVNNAMRTPRHKRKTWRWIGPKHSLLSIFVKTDRQILSYPNLESESVSAPSPPAAKRALQSAAGRRDPSSEWRMEPVLESCHCLGLSTSCYGVILPLSRRRFGNLLCPNSLRARSFL